MSDKNKKEDKNKESKPIIVRNTTDLQRLKLEKLMKNPTKPIIIPEKPKEKGVPTVPDFVRNVMGSSAGAGSGEFHVYRHLRRKEYARQKFMKEKGERERLDDEYQEKLERNRKLAEERTAKKRQKRLKRKQKQRKNTKKAKSNQKTSSNDSSDSESSNSEDEDLSKNADVNQKDEEETVSSSTDKERESCESENNQNFGGDVKDQEKVSKSPKTQNDVNENDQNVEEIASSSGNNVAESTAVTTTTKHTTDSETSSYQI